MKAHIHDVAAISCGMLMGAVFLTYMDQNAARSPVASLVTPTPVVVVDVSSSEMSSEAAVSSEASSESSVRSEASSEISLSSSVPKKPAAPETIKPAMRQAAPEVPIQEETLVPSNASASSSASVSPVQSNSSSEESSSSAQASSSVPAEIPQDFPAFEHASWPVGKVPNWGAMTKPAEWTRSYDKLTDADFVAIPRYDMGTLTTPMANLHHSADDATMTAKLFYSTRFFGSYDLDSGEFTGSHAGVDLKLARGTPIGAIGGGRVTAVRSTQMLGTHVIIEHRLKNGETYYSIYGHLDRASVSAGQAVKPGTTVGIVGMTGNTTAPHLHLQVDIGQPGEDHVPFFTESHIGSAEAAKYVVNPVRFLSTYRSGE